MERRWQKALCGLVLLCLTMAHAAGDKASCVDMHVFSETYATLQESVESLQSQMRRMKSSLDATVLSSCGQSFTFIPVPTFNLTYCDFENGRFCNFTQDTDDQGNWAAQHWADHTFGTTTGTLASYHGSHWSYHGRITSAVFYKSTAMCIRFYFVAAPTDHVQVFIKQVGAGHGYPILVRSGVTNVWTLAEVQVDPEYLGTDVQLQFEAWGSGYISIDDISVYDVSCSTKGIRTPPCVGGNYTFVNGTESSCYTFHVEPRTWRDSVLACKKEWPDANLLAIESAAEQTFLVNAIKSDPSLSQTGQLGYWTTGNDADKESTFIWSGLHKPLTYTNWHTGQPNNVGGHQDCLLLQYATDDYEWGDVDCSERHPFICESTYQRI